MMNDVMRMMIQEMQMWMRMRCGMMVTMNHDDDHAWWR